MIEALLDPKTWLFALFAALDNVPNSLTNQRTLIISSFGFTYLDTTLLSCIDGLIEIVTIWTGVTLATRIPNSRAYVSVIYFLPAFVGVFMIEFLPWREHVAMLFGIWLVDINGTGFVLSLAWLTSVTAGHTKRVRLTLAWTCVSFRVSHAMCRSRRTRLYYADTASEMQPVLSCGK